MKADFCHSGHVNWTLPCFGVRGSRGHLSLGQKMSTKPLTLKPSPAFPVVVLPDVSALASPLLAQLTAALGVPRNIVATDEQIGQAWSQLPRLIKRIPPELRDERIVKMCVAVASGLFDAAINYVWNAAIVELRQKVHRFGISVVPQVLDDKSFDADSLLDMKDAELLNLCLKLNLIDDSDFFFFRPMPCDPE